MFDESIIQESWGNNGIEAVRQLVSDNKVMSRRTIGTIQRVIELSQELEFNEWVNNQIITLLYEGNEELASNYLRTFNKQTLNEFINGVKEKIIAGDTLCDWSLNLLLKIDRKKQQIEFCKWLLLKKKRDDAIERLTIHYHLNYDEIVNEYKQVALELSKQLNNLMTDDQILDLIKHIGAMHYEVAFDMKKNELNYLSFIKQCMNKRLIFIIKTTKGNVFGGVLFEELKDIENNCRHIVDTNAFLFSISDNKLIHMKQKERGQTFTIFNTSHYDSLFIFINGFEIKQPPKVSYIKYPDVMSNEMNESQYCTYYDESHKGISLLSDTLDFIVDDVIAIAF